jgi:hypothetical protein
VIAGPWEAESRREREYANALQEHGPSLRQIASETELSLPTILRVFNRGG